MRRFLVVFVCLGAAYYAIAATPWFLDTVQPAYLAVMARSARFALAWFGVDALASGTTLFASGFAVDVRQGCDAIEPAALFIAALLAFPATWRARLVGALIGVTVLQILNVVRIASLVRIGQTRPDWFETIHVEVWPPVFLVVTAAIWLGWAGIVTRGGRS